MRMIQFLPYTLRSPDRTEIDYAVLAIMLESKWMKDITKPKHSVFIPHRDPITCPVFWMLLHLHMILDYYKSAVTDKINWLDNETFYGIKILFGRDPEKAIKGESQSKQFNRIFEIANVVSTKKLHGGRVGQAQKLEEKGVDQGQIARGLHWATNIMNGHYLHSVPFEQVTASAGYGRNEKYYPLHLDGAIGKKETS
ncbi:hypothetical protein BKA69DRAFT_208690 [Paraphysoderma sedebokerense]|nr:hypothetical protein BKA69DRAFT_208690 [Paraphysoderma sedebokerense]